VTKYQRLGRPEKVLLGDYLWKRGELVEQVTIPLDLLTWEQALPSRFRPYDQRWNLGAHQTASTLLLLRPGEASELRSKLCEVANDMWSYMCLFAALYLGYNVFYGNGGRSTAFSWVEQLYVPDA
jgi:hypothetical protein